MSAELVKTNIPWRTPGVIAARVERVDEGPMRPVATGRRRRPVGSYYSIKNGCGLPWESRNELYAFYHAEVRTDVVRYLAQPHTWEVAVDGSRFRFTPDLMLHLADGRVEVVEIKGDFDEFSDPDYAAKLGWVTRLTAQVGWSFRVIDREELEAQPLFKAVEEIQNYRRTAINTADVLLVSKVFDESEAVALAEIKAAYANPVLGMAKAYGMVARRIIAIDLSQGLSDEARVQLVRRTGGAHG